MVNFYDAQKTKKGHTLWCDPFVWFSKRYYL